MHPLEVLPGSQAELQATGEPVFPSRRAIPRPPRGRENSSKQTGLSGLPPLRAVRAGNAATGWKRTRLGACRALTGKKRGTQSASHLPVSPAVPGLMPLDHEHISFHSDGLAQGHGGGGGGARPFDPSLRAPAVWSLQQHPGGTTPARQEKSPHSGRGARPESRQGRRQWGLG